MKHNNIKEKYIFKKKHMPAFLSLTSLILAVLWIFIVLSGVLKEFDVESIKSLNGKKIVFSLKEAEPAYEVAAPAIPPEELRKISVVFEFEDFSLLDSFLNTISKSVTLAVSPDTENFLHVKEKLNGLDRDYIIKLPLSNSYVNNPYNIYPNIDPNILANRLDYLLSGSKALGVYNIGNEEYLESDLTNFANIINTIKQKQILLI